jgi:hypothetical protein
MGTMACIWHVPYYNGFHNLYNGHVDLEQWLSDQVDPTLPVGIWNMISKSGICARN